MKCQWLGSVGERYLGVLYTIFKTVSLKLSELKVKKIEVWGNVLKYSIKDALFIDV